MSICSYFGDDIVKYLVVCFAYSRGGTVVVIIIVVIIGIIIVVFV